MPHCTFLKPGKKHPDCLQCGLFNGTAAEPLSSPFMAVWQHPKYGVENPVLIVGEAPAGNDDLRGRQFVGKSGTLLRETLKENGVDPLTCAYQNAVRCRPPKNKLPGNKPAKFCKQFLAHDIEVLRPSWIIVLGKTAAQSLLGVSSIKKARRHLYEYTLEDGTKIPCVAAFHPNATFHDANLKADFVGDIAYACQAINGTLPKLKTYSVVQDATVAQVERFHDELLAKKFPIVSCDLETNHLRPYLKDKEFQIFCASLSDGKRALVVKLDEKTPNVRRLCNPRVYEAWKAIMVDDRIAKVNHNIKYDMNSTWVRFGFDWENVLCDTQTLHYYLNPINVGHDLESLAATMLPELGDFKSETNDGLKETDRIYAMPYEHLAQRCGMDAIAAFKIFKIMTDELRERPKNEQDVFWDLVMQSYTALYRMEKNGIRVDIPYLDSLEVSLNQQMDDVVDKLRSYPTVRAFEKFNLKRLDKDKRLAYREWKRRGSLDTERKQFKITKAFENQREAALFRPSAPQSVAALLFGAISTKELADAEYEPPPNFACPIDEKSLTKTGLISTDDTVLARFRDGEVAASDEELKELLTDYLEFKSIQKRVGTYVVGLRKHIGADERIHTTYNVNRADTGRNSSSKPNMQNQPRTPDQRNIFIATDGYKLVPADYSQLELRVMAAECQDEHMIDLIRRGIDLHATTARRVYGIPDDQEVPKHLRDNSKTTNFGVLYGQSAYGLARRLGITEEQAQQLVDGLFVTFPAIEVWQDKTRRFARKHGFVRTMFGNRRVIENARLEGASYDERIQKEHAMRQAINAPIQGAAAQIKNAALVELDRVIRERHYPVRLVIEVHDDITAEVPEQFIPEWAQVAHEIMTTAHLPWIGKRWGDVPLDVELKCGDRWGALEKLSHVA